MNSERRSPWVVLGIPFPADKATAKRAFARRAKALRHDSNLPWTQEDLAWAEAEIALAVDKPESSVQHYRIPADPAAYERPRDGELFVLDSLPLPRTTMPTDATFLDQACADALVNQVKAWLADLTPDPAYDPYQPHRGAETEKRSP